MNVRGDGVRGTALLDRRLGDCVVEAPASVSYVENDATLFGGESGGQELAILYDIRERSSEVRCARISMREGVFRAQ
jgi:hypothetical protein